VVLNCRCVQYVRVVIGGALAWLGQDKGHRRVLDHKPCLFLLEVWSPSSPVPPLSIVTCFVNFSCYIFSFGVQVASLQPNCRCYCKVDKFSTNSIPFQLNWTRKNGTEG
jgi:hypothetical protein